MAFSASRIVPWTDILTFYVSYWERAESSNRPCFKSCMTRITIYNVYQIWFNVNLNHETRRGKTAVKTSGKTAQFLVLKYVGISDFNIQ